MATIDVANNMSFFPTSYSADGQAAAGSYGNYPASSNYMQSSSSGSSYQTGFEDEPPLLEELGINFAHIRTKSLSVLNPLKRIDSHIMDDTDLAGPLFFALMMGVFLLLTGKIHFGYIYGMGGLGCAAMYIILNLMCEQGIDVS